LLPVAASAVVWVVMRRWKRSSGSEFKKNEDFFYFFPFFGFLCLHKEDSFDKLLSLQ